MKSNRNEQRFDDVYGKYKNMIYRIGFAYLKNEADVADLMQEVFIKWLIQSPDFESEEHEKRWLIRVAVNLAKNQVKSFWRNKVTWIEDAEECEGWKFNNTERELYAEVMRLPEKQKIAIYLHYFEGYTCREIAQILQCGESAVKMRLKKAREVLKDRMEDEYGYEIV